jgi:small subunit ribosomal protein S9
MTPESERPEDGRQDAEAPVDQPEDVAAPTDEPVTGQPDDSPVEQGAEPAGEEPAEQPPEPVAEQPAEPVGEQPPEPVAERAPEPVADEQPQPVAEQPAEPVDAEAAPPTAEPAAAAREEAPAGEKGTREKPVVPGADLEVDIVPEGADPLARGDAIEVADYEAPPEPETPVIEEEPAPEPIAAATIDLAAGARYGATGKRKTAVARVILRPGTGSYTVNGRSLEEYFPRQTLQRTIRQPLETVGYDARMDVVVNLHGGGVSAQAGALRHGISRALIEADPNLRGELKRRGFLTRDSRAKERKKAGLKKARKRPQFSKR